MLDLGFIEDVEKILRMCPSGRQTALFSATMPPPIKKLAEGYMYDPTTIRITPKTLTVDAISAGLRRGRRQREGGAPGRAAEDRRTGAGDHLHPHQDRRLEAGEDAEGQRPGRQGAARRPQPGRPRRGDDRLQGPPREAAGGDRHRRPRARHRARHPRHQLRRARTPRRSTCTASAAPAGSAAPAARSPSSPRPSATRSSRIERDVKTSIGEWESPEERLEHAPRPRRRERPSAPHAQAERARGTRERSVQSADATSPAETSPRGEPVEAQPTSRGVGGGGQRGRARHGQALRQPRRAQRHRRGGPALGAARGRGPARGVDPRRPRPAPLLLRRGRPRPGRACGRVPRRHQARRARKSGSRSLRVAVTGSAAATQCSGKLRSKSSVRRFVARMAEPARSRSACSGSRRSRGRWGVGVGRRPGGR